MSDSYYKKATASALSSLTGVDSIAQEFARAASLHDKFESLLKPSQLLEEQEQMRNSLGVSAFSSEYSAAHLYAGIMDEGQRIGRGAMGALAQLRDESIWERECERAKSFSSLGSLVALQSYATTIENTQSSVMESVRKTYDGINIAAKAIVDSLDAERLAMIEAASRPYASLVKSVMRESAAIKSLRDVMIGSSWIEQLNLPVIDAAAASAVAKAWGNEGALREISSLGLDAKTMQALAESLTGTAEVGAWQVDNDEPDGAPSAAHARRLSLEQWFSIIGVLLAILVPIWQKTDSDATEARLAAELKGIYVEVEDHEKKSAERVEALSNMVNRMIEKSAPRSAGEIDFVVRSRVTLIRALGKSGSEIVAEVFPNQVVKLVWENGKWIQVRYFDWNAREERIGWALKKYFLRVDVGGGGL